MPFPATYWGYPSPRSGPAGSRPRLDYTRFSGFATPAPGDGCGHPDGVMAGRRLASHDLTCTLRSISIIGSAGHYWVRPVWAPQAGRHAMDTGQLLEEFPAYLEAHRLAKPGHVPYLQRWAQRYLDAPADGGGAGGLFPTPVGMVRTGHGGSGCAGIAASISRVPTSSSGIRCASAPPRRRRGEGISGVPGIADRLTPGGQAPECGASRWHSRSLCR